MKKQELVHLHALFAEVRRSVELNGEPPEYAFRDYDEFGVRPTSIHRGKDAHREAMRRLSSGIIQTIDAPDVEQEGPQPLSAD